MIDAKKAWPDYTYTEMLTLVFDIMREKNPELAGEKKKFAMKPPEVPHIVFFLFVLINSFYCLEKN